MILAPGLSGRAALVVTAADTALACGSGEVPVLATPRLLALCEQATVAAVAGALAEGLTTVGSRVALEHLAPSAVGARVEASATLEAVAGSRLAFRVEAHDAGRPVARGTVERVVVERARFIGQAPG